MFKNKLEIKTRLNRDFFLKLQTLCFYPKKLWINKLKKIDKETEYSTTFFVLLLQQIKTKANEKKSNKPDFFVHNITLFYFFAWKYHDIRLKIRKCDTLLLMPLKIVLEHLDFIWSYVIETWRINQASQKCILIILFLIEMLLF